eukprot:CAMPEP_0194375846 /NCGR_PEP_ID=MMETSP0174-20130528/24400_1 /TAXON_ID=216777 /ORGANISM="Proboscia alata, Strain PI-D3" /LENGTH=335 /DNA_ID=CAMNT_0039156309 /DNA_START=220 /DNA_END=1224 /DNA_ORIENTATION=+
MSEELDISHYSPNRLRRHNPAPDSERLKQTLSSFWDITPGTPSYSSLTFTFPYTVHSSKVTSVGVELRGATCNPITDTAFTSTSNFNTDGTGTVEVVIDPALIASSSTYVQSGGDATVTFCQRFSLSEATMGEVNFVQTVATISIDLTSDFAVTSINVAEAEKITTTTSLQYGAVAYYCDEDGSLIVPGDLNQGLSVKVCVEPDNINVVNIEKITDFTWTSSTGVTQYAVGADGLASNSFTVVDCTTFANKCSFESLFVASFFQEIPMSVSSTGKVYLQFATSGRNLQRDSNNYATSDGKQSATISIVHTPSFGMPNMMSSAPIDSFYLGRVGLW